MFTVSVAKLKQAPAEERRYGLTGAVRSLPGGAAAPIRVVSPVVLVLTITNAGDFLWAVGETKATVRLTCSRCLKEFTVELAGRIEEKYRLHGAASPEEEIPLATDELDFTDQVIESLLLALPMKPLCREDCRGLCPRCGKDLNEGPCGCPADEGDPRLVVLKKLL
ncbi:YceD family protein [Thermodesulfitimonas sp.]